MDIISELKWILVKRENQKSIIVDREFQDYPPGSVITTNKGTLGKFWSIFDPVSNIYQVGFCTYWSILGWVWVYRGLRPSGIKFKHAICLRAF